jgi:hypothetical protein
MVVIIKEIIIKKYGRYSIYLKNKYYFCKN